ncbi:MAG: hypothetical protein JWN44_7289 [Myxococcales bacterium]|nr:hypothetical protein [Myxococcales bacterium]
MRILLTLFAVLIAPIAAANPEPADAVKGYFQALDRQDFSRALAYTEGAAKGRTSRMVEQLKSEAAANHARVEVKVKRLDVKSAGVAEPGRGVPVPVAFHIDVVGHKFCFSKVARKLDGEARFYLDPARPDRIVAIEGRLAD